MKVFAILFSLSMTVSFSLSTALAQVSKPKERRLAEQKTEAAKKPRFSVLKDLQQALEGLSQEDKMGDLYDRLKDGISTPYRAALVRSWNEKNPAWRDSPLPKIVFESHGVLLQHSQGDQRRSIRAEYVLENGVYVRLNGHEIQWKDTKLPETLMKKVASSVGQQNQRKSPKTASQFSLWNWIFPQAHAGMELESMSLDLSFDFTAIFQSLMMYKMVDSISGRSSHYDNHYHYSNPHPHYYHAY